MSKKHRPRADEMVALTFEDGCLFHDAKGEPIELPRADAPLADTHGHLTHFHLHQAPLALARASLAGVELIGVPIDPADDGADPQAALGRIERMVDDAAAQVERLIAAGVRPQGSDPFALLGHVHLWAGVHPYGAAAYCADPAVAEALRTLLARPRTVGVGEFGLDYGPYNKVDPEVQKRAFVAQLRLAHELDMPVELHIRDAERDVSAAAHVDAAQILEREGVPAAGCDLHCYTSDPAVARPFVELGCFVAFGGAATFARSEDIRAAAVACPEQLILSETDSPYMAPMPLRGMECEPAMVAFSAACVAQAREEAGVATCAQTYAALWHNAQRLFGVQVG